MGRFSLCYDGERMPSRIDELSEKVVPEDEVNWKVVKLIVEKYTDRHPEEVAGCIIHVKGLRQELKNRFGSWETEGRERHIFELPVNLEMALSIKYPKLLKEENLKQFLGIFPQFQVAENL